MSNDREGSLARLRAILRRPELPFPPAAPAPLTAAERMVVTEAAGTPYQLALRFGQELEKLYGSYEIMGSAAEVRLALLHRLDSWAAEEEAARRGPKTEMQGQERMVLGWAPDRLPGRRAGRSAV
jgi:hypothetical protein